MFRISLLTYPRYFLLFVVLAENILIDFRLNLSIAEWNNDIQGIHFQKFGYTTKEGTILLPEETLFLIDQGVLELNLGGLPVSLCEAYMLLLPLLPSVEYYEVYAYVCRLGFMVTRYCKSESETLSKSTEQDSSLPVSPTNPSVHENLLNESFEPMASGHMQSLWCEKEKPCMKPEDATNVLGEGTAYDVLVLSYKKTCKHNQHGHIEYIEAGVKTTWTSGRNFLYKFVKEGKYYQKYQYYIFMDEGVTLLNNHLFENNGLKLLNLRNSLSHSLESPWRKFENILSFYETAVGEVDNEDHSNLLLTRPLPLIIPPCLSGFAFDAMFNALHVVVLDNLLPYNEKLDSKSWWASQQFMRCKIFFRFHAQMIIFLPLLAKNCHHSTYPKGLNPINEICAEEYERAPVHIRRANATSHLMSVKDYESAPLFPYIAPPKTSKEAYKYFEQNFPSWPTIMHR